ncbi:disulfide bond formation protein DsbA [Mucilaginibacter sp. PAMC 26640]|nr:disulfide bond formation protein DsbA [Mucilaginibacter sp. PAMC 26640]
MQLQRPVSGHEHIQGSIKAMLELVEYGDYQCSSCGESYLIIKAAQEKLGKELSFEFRNFPLMEQHPDAFNAAMAAESAGLQNKFWEMYELLFINQDNLSNEDLFIYAGDLGLNIRQFEQNMQSRALRAIIEADYESGLKSGVTGTPTFYINGKKYDGDWEDDGLINHLKELLG